MSYEVIDFELEIVNREEMRRILIETMLKEKPGTGTGENSSKYRYNVEKFKKYAVYLGRPATLNYGLDFTVNVDGLWFKKKRRYSAPSHGDVIDVLKKCKEKNPTKYPIIAEMINKIYNCEQVDMSEELGIFFEDYEGNEHPIEIILLVIKWLFMEQDCTYWNFSGRGRLYDALKDNELV